MDPGQESSPEGWPRRGFLVVLIPSRFYLSSDCLCFWFLADRAKHHHEQFGR